MDIVVVVVVVVDAACVVREGTADPLDFFAVEVVGFLLPVSFFFDPDLASPFLPAAAWTALPLATAAAAAAAAAAVPTLP